MMSCILVLYILIFTLSVPGTATVSPLRGQPPYTESLAAGWLQTSDPDALYAHRDDLASARAAERIWADRLARNPKDFESAWKPGGAGSSRGNPRPENQRKG